jgi:hypothetical protein
VRDSSKKKGPTKRFRGWVYSKKAAVLSIDFSLNNFSLDRGIIGCATFETGGIVRIIAQMI